MNNSADIPLEAAAIGSNVPPGHRSVVIHSVFRTAVNLQPSSGGNLIMLLSHESADHPQGIRLATAQDFTTHWLQPNSTGRINDDGIFLDRPEDIAPLRISFSKAIRLKPEPLPIIQHLGASWKACVEFLDSLQMRANTDLRIQTLVAHGSAQGILGERLTTAALELGEAIVQTGVLNSAHRAISKLVGLGSGLTPSGDDFLCGFLTAAHCRHGAQSQFLLELKRAVLTRLENTNAISATFLRCAAEGKVCKALHELAKALQSGTHCRNATRRLCAFGHSSGMDITTGFLYGLTVWK